MLTNRIDSEIRDRMQGNTCHFERSEKSFFSGSYEIGKISRFAREDNSRLSGMTHNDILTVGDAQQLLY
jgi:hypothetical protein